MRATSAVALLVTTGGVSAQVTHPPTATADHSAEPTATTGVPIKAPATSYPTDQIGKEFLQSIMYGHGVGTTYPTVHPSKAPSTTYPTNFPTSGPSTKTPLGPGETHQPTTASPTKDTPENHYPFDPTNTMMTYWDEGTCGPRTVAPQTDGYADLDHCTNGWEVARQEWPFGPIQGPNTHIDDAVYYWNHIDAPGHECVKGTANCCAYYGFTIYKCKTTSQSPTATGATRIPTTWHQGHNLMPTATVTGIPTTAHPTNTNGIANYGQDCWGPCGGVEGRCAWCGVDAVCCRWNWGHSTPACVGNGIHGQNKHVCTLPNPTSSPTTQAPTKHPTSPTASPITPSPSVFPTTRAPHGVTDSPTDHFFDPTSQLVSYWDYHSCGPRGNNAKADLSQCTHGASMGRSFSPIGAWRIIFTDTNGCEYYAYTVYTCNTGSQQPTQNPSTSPTGPTAGPQTASPSLVFDPTDTLVDYWDFDDCGPREDDARADLSQCQHGSEVAHFVSFPNAWQVVTTIGGCSYYAYTQYRCLAGSPTKTPTTVAYGEQRGCCELDGRFFNNIRRADCDIKHTTGLTNYHGGAPVFTLESCEVAEKINQGIAGAPGSARGAGSGDTDNQAYGMQWAEASGDPITTFKGKSTQFYLKVGAPAKLITCGKMSLFGRTFTSKIEGDHQQWFDQYKVRVEETEMTIAVRKVDLKADKNTADRGHDVTATTSESKQDLLKSLLQRMRKAVAQSEKHDLTTIDVTVREQNSAEVKVATTGAVPMMKNVNTTATITQGTETIGAGHSETVDIQSPHVTMQIVSAIAKKFSKQTDQLEFLHLDLGFPQIDASSCAGPLTEIWGIRPMSLATSKLLLPPEK